MEEEKKESTEEPHTTPTPPPTASAASAAPTNDFEKKRQLIGVLSYLSILVVVAYSMADKDERLLFHVRQGAVLFAVEVATIALFSTILFMLWPLSSLIQLGLLVLSIIGIINAVKGRDTELPLIGHLAKHVPF